MGAVGVPETIRRAPLRTVRPQDLAAVYAHPRPQLARLTERGVVTRLATGYYMALPDTAAAGWQPSIEAAGLAIAGTIFGADDAILTGLSAARFHSAIPRALAVATVAVPRQHRPIELAAGGTIQFVKRQVDRLDARSERLEGIGSGLVATEEQTVLDLAHRQAALDLPDSDFRQIISILLRRSNQDQLAELARDQRRGATLKRLRRDWSF